MIPAAPNPLLMCGDADPLDEYGKIERSVRNRRSAGAHWSRTFTAVGSLTTWTFRICCKRSDLANYLRIFGIGNDSNSVSQHSMTFYGGSGEVQFILTNAGATVVAAVETNAAKRDPAAHCDLQFTWDTTNPTASERLRIHCDGVRQTVKSTTYPAQNTAGLINTAALHRIGALSASSSYWFDGYMSHIAFIDGQAVEPSVFGQTHPRTGQWRPKSKAAIRAAVADGGGARNGWGTNGFFLPFDDVTSLTTLGYDRSQSDTDTTGNNWTATNVSLTAGETNDSALDTPTRNTCTLSALKSTLAPSNGGLTLSGGGESHGTMVIPKDIPTYLEVKTMSSTSVGCGFGIGVARDNIPVTTSHSGGGVGVVGFYASASANLLSDAGGVLVISGLPVANDVMQVAIDWPKMWVGRNDIWLDAAGGTTGNPAAGANPTFTLSDSHRYVPYVHVSGDTAHANYGQRAWGRTCPTGFTGPNVKDLPIRPSGPMKSTNAFVAVTDTGANIQAALAAARSSFGSDYIDIIKRRDAAEGWRWIFSDDPGSYLDTSTPNEKAAVPAFSGTSYVGYSLKVSAANGVATGTFNHTTGSASVISDGLSNARKMVILHRESAGGGAFYTYHPDCATGKLFYLNTTAIETTDASINTVTAGGFTAAASLPSGIYRWMSFAEIEGFLKLSKHVGNGSANGPHCNAGMLPAFRFVKNITNVSYTQVSDAARNPTNPVIKKVSFTSPAEENNTTAVGGDAQNTCDFVSGGWTIRDTDSPTNYSGSTYVSMTIGAFTFRYANAR